MKASALATAIPYRRLGLSLKIAHVERKIVGGRSGAINAVPLFCEDDKIRKENITKIDMGVIGELAYFKSHSFLSEHRRFFKNRRMDIVMPIEITMKCGA